MKIIIIQIDLQPRGYLMVINKMWSHDPVCPRSINKTSDRDVTMEDTLDGHCWIN